MSKGHVLISGPGRAGTTFLMRVLTAMGLDTGFDAHSIQDVEKREGKAGLEHRLIKARTMKLPEIIKSPHASLDLAACLEGNWCQIDHCIIPIRSLADAAKSRVDVQKRTGATVDQVVPGGLCGATTQEEQEAVLAQRFYSLMLPLARYEIPVTFLEFPRFALEYDYFLRAVGGFLKDRYKVSEQEINKAYYAQLRPDFITIPEG